MRHFPEHAPYLRGLPHKGLDIRIFCRIILLPQALGAAERGMPLSTEMPAPVKATMFPFVPDQLRRFPVAIRDGCSLSRIYAIPSYPAQGRWPSIIYRVADGPRRVRTGPIGLKPNLIQNEEVG